MEACPSYRMKILALINLDYNFSAMLTKVCDSSNSELVFLDNALEVGAYSNHNNVLIILDVNEWKKQLEDVINECREHSSFPIIGLLDKMDLKLKRKSNSIGLTALLTKSMFIYNIKTIEKQILNASSNT